MSFNRPLDVCVVSYGGVGCTALMTVLSKFIRVNNKDDKDGLKHKNSPELNIYKGSKIKRVIYVYNNPMNAVLSLFRRHYQRAQHKKLTGRKAPEGLTLKQYVESGIDMFEMEQHFNNWAQGSTKFPILLVNSKHLYKPPVLRRIMRFLKINIPISLFKQKPRKSNYKTVDPQIREGLEKIYMKFSEELDSLPKVKLVKKLKQKL